MKKYIAVLSALPAMETPVFAPPAMDATKAGDLAYMLKYSAELIAAKADFDRKHGGGESVECAIAVAHLLATLPREKIGAVADDAKSRAFVLSGLAVIPMSDLIASVRSVWFANEAKEDASALVKTLTDAKPKDKEGKAKLAEAEKALAEAEKALVDAKEAKAFTLWRDFVFRFKGVKCEAESQKDIAQALRLADSTSSAFYVAVTNDIRHKDAGENEPHLREMLSEITGETIPGPRSRK